MTGLLRRTRRCTRDPDEGAALILVVFAILVAESLSVLLLGMVLAQVSPTIRERKHARTVHAAEAGLHAGLSQIRAATTVNALGVSEGDRSKLPCGPITGMVGGESGNIGYTVTISYFATDPSQETASWRTANALPCVSGYGPSQVPGYALLKADGTGDSAAGRSAASGNRSLESIYTLQVTNANLAGGQVHNYTDTAAGSLELCFDAGSASPSAGAPVRVASCIDEGQDQSQQLFAYTTNYNIVLTSTQTASKPNGMCVTYTSSGLVMQDCNLSLGTQKWGFNANAQFQYQANSTSTKYCIAIQSDNISLSATSSTCGQGYSWRWAWAPAPKVGAGNAGAQQLQLVNYEEFGRCFDDTAWVISSNFLISYPCKQDPNGSPGWNEQLSYDADTGHLTMPTSSGSYCATAASSEGGFVTLTTCSSTQANQRWTEMGATGDYTTAYTVVDYQGRCMALGSPPTWAQIQANGMSDATLEQWSTIVSSTCDGGLDQKWNAPPNLIDAANGNTREITGQ